MGGEGQSGAAVPGTPRIMRVEVATPQGRLQGNFPVPPGEIRLSELAWLAMPLKEKLIGMAVKADSARGKSVSCRAGCGACCRQVVPVSPPEAWLLLDLVGGLPPPRRQAILERFQKAGERWHGRGFEARWMDGNAGEEDFEKLGLDWFRQGVACPFLEEESCSIHPQRPSSCREYLVSSPAENCAQVGALAVDAVPDIDSLANPLAEVAADFLGIPITVMPMTLALDWALAHKEEGRRRFDAVELMTALIQRMYPNP